MSARELIIALATVAPSVLALPADAVAAKEYCAPLPPQSSNVDVSQFEYVSVEGTRVWGSLATYTLSTGDTAEAYLLIDSNNSGEAHFTINGDLIAYVTYTGNHEGRDPTIVSWTPVDTDYPPDLIAELLQDSIGERMIYGMVPSAFPCSDVGKKAVKGAKYLWVAVVAVAGATCCMATQAGCPLCAGAAAAATAAGVDTANGYCD